LLSDRLMVAIREISARLGRPPGRGTAGNTRRHYSNWMLQSIVILVLIANTINIGADIGAMGDAVKELVGGPRLLYVVAIAALCALLQIFTSYERYARILRWLTLALFAYFATVAVVHVPWGEAARGFFVPTLSADPAFWTTVVAILGTTISPYLFFWQASQEVEEVRPDPAPQPVVRAPGHAPREFEAIRLDPGVGMVFSILVALPILIPTATTLHMHGTTEIETSAQAASALRPLAGEFAFVIFALGIIGTGLLAVPVLAGSAAYA